MRFECHSGVQEVAATAGPKRSKQEHITPEVLSEFEANNSVAE